MPSKTKLAKIACPDCGSNNWQRVEVAYKSGTSEQSGTALFAGSAGLNVGALSSTSRTQFAESLAPPPRRTAAWAQWLAIVGGGTAVVGGIAMAAFQEAPEKNVVEFGQKMLIGGICAFAISFLGLASASKYNKTKWPRLIDEWRRHFVCLKCGCVWIPDQTSS